MNPHGAKAVALTKFIRVRTALWNWAGGVPIRVKIMGIVLGMVLVLGGGITWEVRVAMATILTEELRLRAMSIVDDLAARAADDVLTNNLFALHRLANQTVANNPDVRYAFIVAPDGQVLVHTFGNRFPADLLAVHDDFQAIPGHLVALESEEGPLLDVVTPILDGRAGVARVGLSQSRMEEALHTITAQLLLATAIVSAFGVGAAYFLTFVLTAPVLDLVSVTRAIEGGDFSLRARVWANDELGWLAKATNAMAASLRRSRQDLEASHAVALQQNLELTILNAVAMRAAAGGTDTNRWVAHALEPIVLLLGFRRAAVVRCDPDTGAVLWRLSIRNAGWIASELAPYSFKPFRVPLTTRNRNLGALFFWGGTSTLAPSTSSLLDRAAAEIALGLDNQVLLEEVRRKEELRSHLLSKVISAQEDERKRIARELHDEAGQALTSVMVGLRLVENRLHDPELAVVTGTARETVANTLDGVRRLARELRPSLLDDLGLIAALERYVSDYRNGKPFSVDFHMVGLEGLRLEAPIETTLYRIAQEALTNAVRHAKPANVSVVIERRENTVVLIVEDDGEGFDAAAVSSSQPDGHFGLLGMQERAELIGARLTIESRPGEGTAVFVEAPLFENGTSAAGAGALDSHQP